MSPTPIASWSQPVLLAVPAIPIAKRASQAISAWSDKDYALVYNYFILGAVGIFVMRRVARIVWRRSTRQAIKLDNELKQIQPVFTPLPSSQVKWWAEKGELEYYGTREPHMQTSWEVVEQIFCHRLSNSWYTCGFGNWMQVLITFTLFSLNTTFVLVGTVEWTGEHTPFSNQMHAIAHRCGFMSLAQVPFIFALTGRNSIVQYATGIEYLQLRFVHKSMAFWMSLEALIHTVEACLAKAEFFGGEGVYRLVFHNQYGQTGIVLISGMLILLAFSPRFIRQRWYELFLVAHVLGAAIILAGLFYHVPAAREWVWVPIAIWAFERTARLVQVLSVNFANRFLPRSPIRRASAMLKDGAIILRVPYKGLWASGQHAYLSFPGLALGQSHPFSIANVPADFNKTESGCHEMLFVIGVRQGVTATVARHLDQYTSCSADIKVTIEGPLGVSSRLDAFENVLLFAGGTGISHISSILADLMLRASKQKTRVRNVKLIWTVRTIDQCAWVMPELIESSRLASLAAVKLSIDFHVTRGSVRASQQQITFLPSHHQGSRNNSAIIRTLTRDDQA
ncbi:ferric-chelate reductase [Microbotryomycetes sp. JL221]|nr:ferric-chelate reductase [Microbotryomycetes sp. JL221]